MAGRLAAVMENAAGVEVGWAGQVVGDAANHDARGEEESCFQA